MSKEATMYNVMAPIMRSEDQEKPFWHRVGVGFENPGEGGTKPTISLRIEALPLHFSGELVMFENKKKDDGRDGTPPPVTWPRSAAPPRR